MNELSLIDLDLSAIDNATLADGTKRHYKQAVRDMIASGVDLFNRQELITYANTLPHSGKSNLKAALSILLDDYVDEAKMSNKSLEVIQRFIWAVDVIKRTLKVEQPATKRNPHWLSQEQVNTILSYAMPNPRDYVVMSLLLGAGLRCEELAELTFDAFSQIPYSNQMRDIITLIGKGGKKRDIPIHSDLAKHIREWKSICKDGRVARRFYKGGKLGKSLDTSRIFRMVRKYGEMIGIENLDPHDLRRSYGRILYYSIGKDIVRVMGILGHEDVKTTQRYIGLKDVLEIDVLPIGGLQVAGD